MIFLVSFRTNNGYMRLCIQLLAAALPVLLSAPVFAAEWSVKPSLELRETYTDNVTFTNPGEEDYITEINPGLAIRAEGPRLNANLGYTLQNIFYAKNSNRNAQYHQLGANTSAELVKDFAFLNLRASDSQRVISPSRGVPVDNLNTVNRTKISALAINPYVKKRFGRKAEGSASYSYETLAYSGGGASDAKIESVTAGLRNGPSFQRMSWSLDYSQKTTARAGASDYSKKSATGQASYLVNRSLGMLFRAGDERNDLASSQGRNGSYYAVGARIMPSPILQIDLLTGNRLSTASLSWSPTPRSALNLVWRDQKVGLNTGRVWKGTMSLANRRMAWNASYLEDTTSVQGVQSLGGGGQQGQSNNLSSSALPLSNALFVRKRGQTTLGYKTAKSLISVSAYEERRLFDTSGNQTLRGGTAFWRWHFASRTTMLLRFRGLNSGYSDDSGGRRGIRLRSADLNFSRKMGRGMDGSVIASSTTWEGLLGGLSLSENRLSVRMKWSL